MVQKAAWRSLCARAAGLPPLTALTHGHRFSGTSGSLWSEPGPRVAGRAIRPLAIGRGQRPAPTSTRALRRESPPELRTRPWLRGEHARFAPQGGRDSAPASSTGRRPTQERLDLRRDASFSHETAASFGTSGVGDGDAPVTTARGTDNLGGRQPSELRGAEDGVRPRQRCGQDPRASPSSATR